MPQQKLRVLPRGTAMVAHYETQDRVRQFHGWKHDPDHGEEWVDAATGQKKRQGAFRKQSEPVEVNDCAEYRRHLRDGDLWPADQLTAQAAGVPFDPTFGGEFDDEPTEAA